LLDGRLPDCGVTVGPLGEALLPGGVSGVHVRGEGRRDGERLLATEPALGPFGGGMGSRMQRPKRQTRVGWLTQTPSTPCDLIQYDGKWVGFS